MPIAEALHDMAEYNGLKLHTNEIYIQFSMMDDPPFYGRSPGTRPPTYRLVKVYSDGLTVRRLLHPDTNPDAEGPVFWINQARVKRLVVVLKPVAKHPTPPPSKRKSRS